MSLTLALNAAEGRLQFTVAEGETLLAAQDWHSPSNGVERLVPALHAAFDLAGLNLAEVGRIACVCGPGGFTGLRLALGTASGLARGLAVRRGQPVLQGGISHMLLLAASAPLPPRCHLWVLTHARRGLVHMQLFETAAPENPLAFAPPTPLTPLEVLDLAAAARRMAEAPLPAHVFGSGLTRNAAALVPLLPPQVTPLPEIASIPSCSALARLAGLADYAEADLQPLYARVSDAEAQLPDIARKLGHDPEESVRRLEQATKVF